MPCSCDARDVVVPQVKSTAWPARGLSGFHAGARTVPFVSALILTSVWVLQHVFFRVLVPCAPVLLAPLIHLFCELLHKPAFPGWTHLPRDKLDQKCRPDQAVPRAVVLQVPLAAQHRVIQRYSTAQEQHTGFSSRYDDTHVLHVYMSDSVQKNSGRSWPKALERARCQVCAGPPLPLHVFSTDIDQNNATSRSIICLVEVSIHFRPVPVQSTADFNFYQTYNRSASFSFYYFIR